jgi:hypothetical protein
MQKEKKEKWLGKPYKSQKKNLAGSSQNFRVIFGTLKG